MMFIWDWSILIIVLLFGKLQETYDKVDGLNSLWREFDALTKLLKCTCKVKCACDASKELDLHHQIIKLMQFLMGLDEYYQPIRSAILTRDPLPDVKDAYNNVSREESHRGFLSPLMCYELIGFPPGFKKFKNNANKAKQSFNANVDVKSDKQHSVSRCSFFNGNVLFNINFSKFFCANNKFVVDVSSLSIIVGHPNETLAIISHIGNLKLNNNIVLYDVIVVPGYCVSLLSVNKLIKDSKIFVGFDEEKCYIQDLTKQRTLGTSSKSGGLYLFNIPPKNSLVESNLVMSFHVSKLLWHNIIGHPADQVLTTLHNDPDISKSAFVPVCQAAVNYPKCPNDKGKTSLVENGSSPLLRNKTTDNINLYQEEVSATQFDGQSLSEGNIDSYDLLSPNQTENIFDQDIVVETPGLTRSNMCFATTLNKSIEPTSYIEALKDNNWVEAMNNEIEALNRNNTWSICYLPAGRKPIGCKWLFKIKYKATCDIERYKARLVTKGFNQREGFDYDETFSPVVKMVTDRCLISIAVKMNWSLYQLDVNNAFLYGDLIEDVYMTLPQGFNNDNGTKQGFVQSKFDYSLYVKRDGFVFVALLVYVDDIVITGNDEVGIKDFKRNLGMKDLFAAKMVDKDKKERSDVITEVLDKSDSKP
ncbi:ribonuclease H-like domain-containing protein [Tanacetum coccineum]